MAGPLDGCEVTGKDEVQIGPTEAHWVTLSAQVPPETAQKAGAGAHPIRFRVERLGEGTVAAEEKSTFVVPR